MQSFHRMMLVIAALWLMTPGSAHAGVEADAKAGWGMAVSDGELALQRAGYAPFSFALTVRNVAAMADAQFNEMGRVTGSMARVTMDIWWSTTGTDLIVANVRATTP